MGDLLTKGCLVFLMSWVQNWHIRQGKEVWAPFRFDPIILTLSPFEALYIP